MAPNATHFYTDNGLSGMETTETQTVLTNARLTKMNVANSN
jgi:hypothetical protein